MKNTLIELIVNKLNENKDSLKSEFNRKHPISIARHFTLDNLLPDDIALSIRENFPPPRKMRLLHSYSELKMKYMHIKNTSNLLQDMHHAIQDPKVIAVIEDITGIKNQLPDTSRIAGGVSALLKGHYINPHLDHSHDIDKKFYRTVNLLYYISPNWKLENGGNFELWDSQVENRIIVPSLFNRLLVMETNQHSWHAVNSVVCNEPRRCVFNYYFSKQSPEGVEYFHGATSPFYNPLIRPRPEQKIRRVIARMKHAFFNLF